MGEFLINSSVNKNYIWVYFIIFFILWCIRELWLVQYLDLLDSIPRTLVSAIVKIVIWIVPVIYLIRLIEQRNAFSYLRLRQNYIKGLKWSGWGSVVFISYFVVVNFSVLEQVDFQLGFNQWLNTILLVGITEEIVFRGFILRKLMDSFRFWVANVITALLFVSIHFPIWFYKDLFGFPNILASILNVFVMGIIFGFVYKKSNSLWSVIILHSLYNLLVDVFY